MQWIIAARWRTGSSERRRQNFIGEHFTETGNTNRTSCHGNCRCCCWTNTCCLRTTSSCWRCQEQERWTLETSHPARLSAWSEVAPSGECYSSESNVPRRCPPSPPIFWITQNYHGSFYPKRVRVAHFVSSVWNDVHSIESNTAHFSFGVATFAEGSK